MRFYEPLIASVSIFLVSITVSAQQITGVWQGKIDRKKVEIKMIQNGDSLTGSSYYYESPTVYRRYSIRGYFDSETNEVVWWDDQLISENGRTVLNAPGRNPMLTTADFNCPGDKMFLEGKTSLRDRPQATRGPVDLEKVDIPIFRDEWDPLIETWTVGSNDPYIIDSIGMIAFTKTPEVVEEMIPEPKVVKRESIPVITKTPPVESEIKPEPMPVLQPASPLTIEEKFKVRKKVFTTEIPLSGDSLELRFYDNAEIDGDSISLFLNGKLIFQHIRLTGNAYTIKLPVHELNADNELIMVAENLGTIPPNTSYMVAIVNEKRYEAKLASTENSSAMIRLKKE